MQLAVYDAVVSVESRTMSRSGESCLRTFSKNIGNLHDNCAMAAVKKTPDCGGHKTSMQNFLQLCNDGVLTTSA